MAAPDPEFNINDWMGVWNSMTPDERDVFVRTLHTRHCLDQEALTKAAETLREAKVTRDELQRERDEARMACGMATVVVIVLVIVVVVLLLRS